MTPDLIEAISKLIGVVAWPTIVVTVALSQRKLIAALLENLESIKLPGGVEAKMRRETKSETESILRADPSAAKRITDRLLRAAERIEELAAQTDEVSIRRQVSRLAREYERLRASLPSGNERTRRMDLVATKMRVLGLAAVRLLPELTESSSPGKRLAAAASLQVKPNAIYIEWLAERFSIEKPFIQYHAAVALSSAARLLDERNRSRLETAVASAKQKLGPAYMATDRWGALDEAESILKEEQ